MARRWLWVSAIALFAGCLPPQGTQSQAHPPAMPATSAGRPPIQQIGGGAIGDLSSDASPYDTIHPSQGPVAPSGFGPTIHDGGVTFRVWAPHADQASVIGDFNNWDPSANPMTLGPGGMFTADVPGAAPGQTYMYHFTRMGMSFDKADARAPAMTNARGHSVILDPGRYAWQTPPFATPPVEAQVIYELHVGTFNVAGGALPATFRAVTEKLDHIAALGANMIELMPVSEFPSSTSWGYNPSSPFAPASAYGTPDDLQALIDGAHARGMGVILDVVHNHYNPTGTGLRCFDGDCLGAYGVYFYADAQKKDTPWGPRPDFSRPEVRAYIEDNTLLWLRDYRVDGFRWDSTINIRAVNEVPNQDGTDLLTAVNRRVHAEFPAALTIAEDFRDDDAVTQSTDLGGIGFGAQWDSDFFHPVDDNIIQPNDAMRSMAAVAQAIAHRLSGRATARVVYTESHDEVANGKERIPQMIDSANPASWTARRRSTLGAAVVFSSPGIPMIFMGQEFLENGFFSDHNPLDWSKAASNAGIMQLYKDLIALRKNAGGNTRGLTGEGVLVYHQNEAAKVLAVQRFSAHGPGDDVIAVFNFSAHDFPIYDLGVPTAGPWHLRFSSDLRAYAPDYGTDTLSDPPMLAQPRDGFGQTARLHLPAYAALILSE